MLYIVVIIIASNPKIVNTQAKICRDKLVLRKAPDESLANHHADF